MEDILTELKKNQKKDCQIEYRLSNNDLNKIASKLDNSIFSDECSLWKGSIINKNNNRAKYINFYFNKKKVALHRLLYINFVENLHKNQYLKYTCKNKGLCCNVNHIKVKKKKQKKKPLKKEKIDNMVSFD